MKKVLSISSVLIRVLSIIFDRSIFGDILLSHTCKIYYVNMLRNYMNVQMRLKLHIYVNMLCNYVNKQHNLCHMLHNHVAHWHNNVACQHRGMSIPPKNLDLNTCSSERLYIASLVILYFILRNETNMQTFKKSK